MHVFLPMTRRFSVIRSGNARRQRGACSRTHLTPREVERRHPAFSRRRLAMLRAQGLPPKVEVHSGCFMYEASEVKRCADAESMASAAPNASKPD